MSSAVNIRPNSMLQKMISTATRLILPDPLIAGVISYDQLTSPAALYTIGEGGG